MRILVLSDTHGYLEDLDKIKEKAGHIDLLIHLGDYSKDISKIKKVIKCETVNVKGNCDYLDPFTKEEEIIEVEGKKIFLTHGHKYNVKNNLMNLYYRAQELEVDIALFGHSHMDYHEIYDGILLFNPGSISSPRAGSKKTFGIIEIKDYIMAKIVDVD